jgi:hypothetical protein
MSISRSSLKLVLQAIQEIFRPQFPSSTNLFVGIRILPLQLPKLHPSGKFSPSRRIIAEDSMLPKQSIGS